MPSWGEAPRTPMIALQLTESDLVGISCVWQTGKPSGTMLTDASRTRMRMPEGGDTLFIVDNSEEG